MFTAQDVLQCWKDNAFIANFFPDIDTPTGEEYFLTLAEYVLYCSNGKFIAKNCPTIFCEWAIHYIAYVLSTWGSFTLAEDGDVITLPNPCESSPAVYLKEKMIGGKTCKYDIIDIKKLCKPCPPTVKDMFESKYKDLMECCNDSLCEPFIGAGTFTPEKQCNTCCSNDDRKSWQW